MSKIAATMRSERQHWAAPGSAHDHLVAVLRVVLPSAVGVVAALMVFLPLTSGGDVSFVLDKNKVEVSKERLKVEAASYRGQDDKGQPFVLTAQSALQKSAAEPIVDMQRLMAKLTLPNGLATLAAPSGKFNPVNQQVDVAGPITFDGPNGYSLKSQAATVDLKKKTMKGSGGVSGTVPQGTFTADTMSADLDNRVVTLDGRARLRIAPQRAR
ncbi:LPS export ABC transporter periplasmic protein LptC [Sphingomonas bacterium]|uniref:LPS export ABC transporter periplasmic protein LptC n=1 Tax=Sphingomonas bacterium TaxID=1895847 RepID=UPI00262B4DAE|nr:LPS export ABC transporter periplasmic protein LptC [Sphingomonas bacterium]MDB5679868.1 export transporter periplasmic protein LptC [Sphingomonas bacterium]